MLGAFDNRQNCLMTVAQFEPGWLRIAENTSKHLRAERSAHFKGAADPVQSAFVLEERATPLQTSELDWQNLWQIRSFTNFSERDATLFINLQRKNSTPSNKIFPMLSLVWHDRIQLQGGDRASIKNSPDEQGARSGETFTQVRRSPGRQAG